VPSGIDTPSPHPVSPIAASFISALGVAIFAVMDAVMKSLSIALGACNAMLWRLAVGAAVGAVIYLLRRAPLPARAGLWLLGHCPRAGAVAGCAGAGAALIVTGCLIAARAGARSAKPG
jgi:hypothetical protein